MSRGHGLSRTAALARMAGSVLGASMSDALSGRRSPSLHGIADDLGLPTDIFDHAKDIVLSVTVDDHEETEEEREARRARMADRVAERERRKAQREAAEAIRAKPHLDAAAAKRERKAAKRLGSRCREAEGPASFIPQLTQPKDGEDTAPSGS